MVALNMENIFSFSMAKLKKKTEGKIKSYKNKISSGSEYFTVDMTIKPLYSPCTEHCFAKVHYCYIIVIYHQTFITNLKGKKYKPHLFKSVLHSLQTLFDEKQ